MKFYLKYALLFTILAFGCLADLYTKEWAIYELKNRPLLTVVDGYMECGYVENRGMVFGILNNQNFASVHPFLKYSTFVGTLFLIIFIWLQRKQSFSYLFPFTLVLAGALGNAIDKIRFGFVVDFIHIHYLNILNWPFFFNVADAFICVGMTMLIIQMIFTDLNFVKIQPLTSTKPAKPE